MAKENINNKEGFTIIEVVLVLAIAGLIFLMVFVALPALQRSQRDTARRNDMSRVDTSLVQYQTNHQNQPNNLPDAGEFKASRDATFPDDCSTSTACAFVRDYMNSGSSENDGKENAFEDPNGVPYSLVITENWALTSPAAAGINDNYGQLSGDTEAGFTIVTKPNAQGQAFDDYTVYIVPGGRCVGDKVTSSTKRHFAVLYRLEGAGTYCIDDQ